MAFPHQKSRQGNDRKGDKPNHRGIVGKFCKWTIDIADNRNAKDEVNPAKNRAFGGVSHWVYSLLSSSALIIQSLSLENLRHPFLNPRPPGFGLFGRGKIKD